jgi:hypothetical protein
MTFAEVTPWLPPIRGGSGLCSGRGWSRDFPRTGYPAIG